MTPQRMLAFLLLCLGASLAHATENEFTASYTTAQTDTVVKSVAAGKQLTVIWYEVLVSKSMGAVEETVAIECDDTTDVYKGGHPGLAAGSGYSPPPGRPPKACTDGQDLLLTISDPTGGIVRVTIYYDEIDVP